MAAAQYLATCALFVSLVAVVATWRVHQTRAAQRQLDQIRAAAHHPYRRLVEILRPIRSTRTGQLLLVIEVRTGEEGIVWLPLCSLTPGDLALLVWMNGEWVLMDRLSCRLRAGARQRSLRPGTR